MTEEFDVAVIGAGIAGAGAAAMLGGRASTVLIEAEDRPGHHSTGRSAAIFIRNYGNPVVRALTRASEPDFEAPPAAWNCADLLTPRGLLLLACEKDRSRLRHELVAGEGLTALSPEEAVGLVPILRRDCLIGASYEPRARDIDVDALHQAWLRLFRRGGGIVAAGAAVGKIAHDGSRWLLQAGDRQISAAIVVNAAGAWADQVAAMAGVAQLGLVACRRSMAVLPAPDIPDFGRMPLFGDIAESWYAKPQSGTLIVSPADEDPVEPHDAFVDDTVLAEGLDRFSRATSYELTRLLRSWAGLRTFAPDRTPVAGFASDAPGFFWLAGQGGYGIQTAPAMSRIAATMILGLTDALPVDDTIAAALSPTRLMPP